MKNNIITNQNDYIKNAIADTELDSMPIQDFENNDILEKAIKFELNSNIYKELQSYAENNKFNIKSIILGMWSIVFSKWSNLEESLVAVSDKNDFIPIYSTFKDICSLEEYIKNIEEHFITSQKFIKDSFEELCKCYDFNAMPLLSFQNNFSDELCLKSFSFNHFKIYLQIAITNTQLKFNIKYDANSYKDSTINSLFSSFCVLASNICNEKTSNILQSCIISNEEEKLLDSFNDNSLEYDNSKSIVDLIKIAVEKYPDNIAVVLNDKKITYKQFDEITDRLASYIVSQGIGKEDVVSIIIPRTELMPICAVGVLKSGAGYQPLDPSYPVERLNFMTKDANAKLLIADKSLRNLVSDYSGNVLLTDEIYSLPKCNIKLPKVNPQDLFIMLYTSGSTGVPKGVMLEHHNLVAFVANHSKQLNVSPNSKISAYASFGFDANMMDMYVPLVNGAQLHIIDDKIRLDLIKINDYFEQNGITHGFMTTQVGRQFAEVFPNCSSLKYLLVGGETLVPIEPPKYTLVNGYGPTEATVYITSAFVDKMYKRVPIGKANSNVKLYILDKFGNRVPVGVPGELCVAGPQVSRGYLNREEQTAKAYTSNPFCNLPEYNIIYHTGDVVRFLSDGTVDFIGRRDSQVKIRGFRIELSEVEEIIRKYNGIKDATVIALDHPSGGKYIVAYVVSDEQVNVDSLNDFIKATKPPYMVPAITMQIDKIPLNQNQKVNKKALPEPKKVEHKVVEPKNETQQQIYDILSKILGHKDFGIDTDIYEAGLTSISSIKFNVLISKLFNISISTKVLKDCNTIEKIEDYINNSASINSFELKDKYPLSQTQLGIYVECMRSPDSVFYNLPGYLTFNKSISKSKLKESVQKVIDAHSAVKCCIKPDDDGTVCMYPQPNRKYEIEIFEGNEQSFEEFMDSFARPMNFEKDILFRIAIYSTKEHNYLAIDFHHIVCDGTSIASFASELSLVLSGKEPEGEMMTQFDVALNEEELRSSPDYDKAIKYYDSVFDGVNGCSCPDRDLFEETESCGIFESTINTLQPQQVEEYCKNNKITPNIFFLSVMSFVMSKYTNTEEVCFTTIYNGRSEARCIDTFGMLVKTLPVYANINSTDKVKQFVSNMKNQIVNSMNNDIYSFAEISHKYDIKPDFMFVYQGDNFSEFDINGESIELKEINSDKAKAPISFNIFIEKGKYNFYFEYKGNMYSKSFISTMSDIFEQTSKSFLQSDTLNDVNITSEKQLKIINDFNNTDYDVDIMSVNKLFENQVQKNPDNIAIIANKQKLTYSQLNSYANKVAHTLINAGLKQNTAVGLIFDRGVDVVAVRQGILKAGGGFLPMIPDYPDDRISFCLEDAQCNFVITTDKIKKERDILSKIKNCCVITIEQIKECTNTENPNLDINVNSLAYCLYTSGSTGKPKGVMIEHKNLCNFVNSNPINTEILGYTQKGSVSLALAAITFDVSVMEEYIPLCNGMTMCMANEDEIHNPLELAKLLLDNKVEVMKCTPSFMTNIIEIPQMHYALSQIKAFDIGAEAFPSALFDKIRKVNKTAQIINSYGPTECTISATTKVLKNGKSINIGAPLTNMKVFVVDKNNRIMPVGISGELIICGDGVGRGYVNLPQKNKEAFFTFNGLKAYHSGDLSRWNKFGEIEFQGRLDNQVKLRGLRVELDEVENAINSFDKIKTSKVVVKNNGSEEFLAGYFTAETKIDVAQLTQHIKKTLAHYMVPGALMQLDKMPLNANGKIDKKQLPNVDYIAEEREYTAPTNELEKEFCDKFAEILNIEKVGINDNFFEIGGTSLSATKIAMYALTKNYEIVYKDIFANPTPAQLSSFILNTKSSLSNKKNSNIEEFDYSEINKIISKNCIDNLEFVKKGELGNILLTGSTGFLGIHILREFIINYSGKVYCLVRKGKFSSCEKRLMNMLMYYFDSTYEQAFEDRIICIDGDITNKEQILKLGSMNFKTVINCAACVKHFTNDDTLDRINVTGVKNIVEMCVANNKKLVQVSTTSVAGEGNELTVPASKIMNENELYFGQILENDYIRTKFLAEKAILENVVSNNLNAVIVRVGNLMARLSDGEFQINFGTNGFMRAINSYKTLGMFPVTSMGSPAEFSPIDSTAAALLKLASANSDFCIYHAYNSHKIFMSDVIYAMKSHGYKIDIVSESVFDNALKSAANQSDKSNAVLGLIAYNSDDKRYEIATDNTFTTEVLYRLEYKWPIIDDTYLENSINALATLEFFD